MNANHKYTPLSTYYFTAKTLENLEPLLAREIEAIGGRNITTGRRAVFFEGGLDTLYRANYYPRTALRILKQIDTFEFSDADDFYVKSMRVKWEEHMDLHNSFSIQSTVFHSEQFNNSMFASLKVKDAVVDRFRKRTGHRPDVDTQNPDITFHVHISRNVCTLSVDSSGVSLHKRGYRLVQGDAPLSEVLAAGMILLSGWDGQTDFVDPMCGSGTLSIEAAMIAKNIPAGKFRKEYAFMQWKDYDAALFGRIREEAVQKEFQCQIFASDVRSSSVSGAQTNARSARVFNLIQFTTKNFNQLELPVKGATLVINPPYGERIEMGNPEGLYSMIGQRLKHQWSGNSAWILSSSPQLLQLIGLKPSQKIKLLNGALECSFQEYKLFQGKRRDALQRS